MNLEQKSKLKLFISVLILSFSLSCSKTNNKGLAVFQNVKPELFETNIQDFNKPIGDGIRITIPNPEDKKILNQSSIIDSISYIRLSDKPEAIVGAINKIDFIDHSIYILDRDKTKSLKKFTSTGEFICQIGNNGEGPQEYVQPTDYTITEKEIIIYDQFKQQMLFYEHNGNFLKSKKAPFLFLEFHQFSSNQFIYYALDQDNDHLQSIVNNAIFESDSNFVLKQRGFSRKKDMYQNLFVEHSFSKVGNKVFFNPIYNDTIFSISKNGSIQIEYILDFGNRKLPKEYKLKENSKKLYSAYDENYYNIFAGSYVVLDDFLYFTFSRKHSVYECIYSKSTGKTEIGNYINRDVAPIFTLENVLAAQHNTLVGYIQPVDMTEGFKTYTRKMWVEKFGEKYTHIAETINEDDNLILLFYHLKK